MYSYIVQSYIVQPMYTFMDCIINNIGKENFEGPYLRPSPLHPLRLKHSHLGRQKRKTNSKPWNFHPTGKKIIPGKLVGVKCILMR